MEANEYRCLSCSWDCSTSKRGEKCYKTRKRGSRCPGVEDTQKAPYRYGTQDTKICGNDTTMPQIYANLIIDGPILYQGHGLVI